MRVTRIPNETTGPSGKAGSESRARLEQRKAKSFVLFGRNLAARLHHDQQIVETFVTLPETLLNGRVRSNPTWPSEC